MDDATVVSQQWHAAYEAEITELERRRPFVLMRPEMKLDGDKWCALYGENIQIGVCGFGNTPEEAARAFDIAWLNFCKGKHNR